MIFFLFNRRMVSDSHRSKTTRLPVTLIRCDYICSCICHPGLYFNYIVGESLLTTGNSIAISMSGESGMIYWSCVTHMSCRVKTSTHNASTVVPYVVLYVAGWLQEMFDYFHTESVGVAGVLSFFKCSFISLSWHCFLYIGRLNTKLSTAFDRGTRYRV